MSQDKKSKASFEPQAKKNDPRDAVDPCGILDPCGIDNLSSNTPEKKPAQTTEAKIDPCG